MLALTAFTTALVAGLPSTAAATSVDLLNQANVQLDGAATGERSGSSVAGAGDVNGDGRPDVIIGGYGASNNTRAISGSSYVIYGQAGNTNIDLASLTTAQGFRIDGAAADDHSGTSVAGAGDVNGDGRDDVIIGSPYADNNTRDNSGSSYVIYGEPTNSTIDLSSLTAAQGFRIDGAARDDHSGTSVAGAGDVNGDGRAGVIIGAPPAGNGLGSSYVVYGQPANTNIDLGSLTTAQGFQIDGEAGGFGSGYSVAGAGDVNGDGRDDVIIGAYRSDKSRTLAGSSYVIYGQAANTNVDLASLTTAQGFRIDGASAFDQSGSSVAGAGDVNGDGRADVIIGSPYADNNTGDDSGSSYVIYGEPANSTIDLSSLTAAQGFRIDGAARDDHSGYSVAGAGDVNGDGRADLLLGAHFANNNSRVISGSTYVIYGEPTNSVVDLSSVTSAQGFRIDGAGGSDQSGIAVAGAGDINGDGRDDVLIGAYGASKNSRPSSGSSYVVYPTFLPKIAYDAPLTAMTGQPFSLSPTTLRSTGPRTITVSPPLPAGLSLDPATGVISGTPTTPGSSSHEVTLTDSLGTTAARITIGVVNPTGATGASGATGATGPAGTSYQPSATRGSEVTCSLQRTRPGKRRLSCRVVLTSEISTRIRWRLTRGGRAWAHGTVSASKGIAFIRISGVNRLPDGTYRLHLKGRPAATRVVIR